MRFTTEVKMGSDLSATIKEKYNDALKNGDVVFTQSSSTKHKDAETGTQYLVTYAPSLLKKPERGDDETINRNPFAEPEPELTVDGDLNDEGEYKLLLNKYPVVPEHALLVTKEFKPQTSALTPKDLFTAYSLIDKLDDEDEMIRHMAFYNCGVNSGSSQDHKHLQLLKLPEKFLCFQDKLCSGQESFIPNVHTEPLQDGKLSFAHFVAPLPEDSASVDEDLLAMTFIAVLQRALTFFQDWTNEKPKMDVSYNVMLTKQWICVVPRSASKSKQMNIGFNATGYVGMVLVKDEEVLKKIQENPHIVDELLLECGFPSTAGEATTQYHY